MGAATLRQSRRIVARPSAWVTYGVLAFFVVVLAGIVGSVLLNSFATSWPGTWLPKGLTTHWYAQAWSDFALADVLLVTFEVGAVVVVLSVLIALPTAYVLARRDFPGKRVVMVLFLLPVVVPTITYGIPLATLLYEWRLAGRLTGVILANLVPAVPFAVLALVPFIEQIDRSLESAARMCGASTRQLFRGVLVPLLTPGVVAVSILVLVRTLAMFELTFLTAGPGNQTLVVKLFYAVSAAGFRVGQSIDAMAVMYMLTNVVLLAVAFRFVTPERMVGRVD
jgi:putative spermidine/putrescine transport system permease protein